MFRSAAQATDCFECLHIVRRIATESLVLIGAWTALCSPIIASPSFRRYPNRPARETTVEPIVRM